MTETTEKRGGTRTGAGRPEQAVKKVTFTTRIHPAAKDRLDEISEESGIAKSVILEHLIASCKKLPETLKNFD